MENFWGIENAIRLYYEYYKILFFASIIVILALTIAIKVCCSNTKIMHKFAEILQNKNFFKENEYVKKVFVTIYYGLKEVGMVVAITIGGIFLRKIGLTNENLYSDIPIFIAIVICMILGIMLVVLLCKYQYNKLSAIKLIFKYFKILIWGELFLLSSLGKLDILEFCVAIIFLWCCKVIDNCKIEQQNDSKSSSMGDLPVQKYESLFESRKVQLSNLLKELSVENRDEEPFAMSISAPWGYGKTSFMNAFAQKCSNGEFIWINVGFECDVVKILDDIEKQLEKIFEKNRIFIGNGNPVEKYFKCIIGFLGETDFKIANHFLGKFSKEEDEGFQSNKDSINKCLEQFYIQSKKKVYIVIDDIERCIPETRDKIFGVIYESVKLKNCTTIFLTDIDKLQTANITKEYLEKYINKTVNLCTVPFEEIIEYCKEDFLTEDFFAGKSKYVKENAKILREEFAERSKDILLKLQSKYQCSREKLENKKLTEEELVFYKEQIDKLQDAISRANRRMCNPRKVKRYMRDGVQHLVQIVEFMWFSHPEYIKNSYSKENWMENILQVSFLRYFLEEDYNILTSYNNLDEFVFEHKTCILDCILEGLYSSTKRAIVEMLIRKGFIFSSSVDMSERDKLCEELNSNQLKQDNLKKYLDEVMGWGLDIDVLEKVLNYVINQRIEEMDVIIQILKKLTDHYYVLEGVLNQQDRLKKYIEKMWDSENVSEQQKHQVKTQINHYRQVCIWSNERYFYWILRLIYGDKEELRRYFADNPGVEINSLKQLIKTFETIEQSDLPQECDDICVLEKYFAKIFKILEDAKYDKIRKEIDKYKSNIVYFIKAIKIWSIEDDVLEERKELVSFERAKFNSHLIVNREDVVASLDLIERALLENDKINNSVVAVFWQYCEWISKNFEEMEKKEILYNRIQNDYTYICENYSNVDEGFYSNGILLLEISEKYKFENNQQGKGEQQEDEKKPFQPQESSI